MIIQVFGPGCTKCREAEQLVHEAVKVAGLDATVEKVSDLRAMMAAGVLTTPAVAVNGTVLCAGSVPPLGDLVAKLMSAAQEEARR